jgi:hypothetical protein
MTAEHITLIEPTDLRAIRIVCKKCRSSLAIQIDETVRIPSECPVCRESWFQEQQITGKASAPDLIVAALKTWRAKEHTFILQFEVATTHEVQAQKR